MVQSIEASKKIIAEKAKAQSACAAVSSLDSITLDADCGLVWEQLTEPVDDYLGITLGCLLGRKNSLKQRFLSVRHNDAGLEIYHNSALFNGENYR